MLAAGLSGLNPKNFALTLAAAATIVTVAGPVVLYVVAPTRSAEPLRSVKAFMAANNATIMIIVLLLLGSKLLGSGIAGL